MAETQRAAVPPRAAAVYTSAAFRSPKNTNGQFQFIFSFNRCRCLPGRTTQSLGSVQRGFISILRSQ
ncbi:hypothetical protein SRHO_G00182730 [Serrasalmus rhombeus]